MAGVPTTSANTRTSHGLSIIANGLAIGHIQSWRPSQQRTVTPIYELNAQTSGDPIDNVPGNVQGLTMQVTRYDIYTQLMETAFGTADLTWLGNQMEPFHVIEKWVEPQGRIRCYQYSGCWFTNLGRGIESTGDRLVQVSADLIYLRKIQII